MLPDMDPPTALAVASKSTARRFPPTSVPPSRAGDVDLADPAVTVALLGYPDS